MKSTKSTTGQVHRRNSNPSIQRLRNARRRNTGIRLEALEERVLLSSTTKVQPIAISPVGLNVAYTTLSEQAHGIAPSGGSATDGAPIATSTTASPMTMAELESYLKWLTSTLQIRSGPPPASASPGPMTPQAPDGGPLDQGGKDGEGGDGEGGAGGNP